MPRGVHARGAAAWAKVAAPGSSLVIAEMQEIGTSPGGKLLDFVSDLFADDYARRHGAPGDQEQ